MSKSRLVSKLEHNRLDHAGGIKCEGTACVFCELGKQVGWLENDLIGKILTIVDASIREERANKAMKDLVRQSIFECTQNNRLACWHIVNSRLEGTLNQNSLGVSPGVFPE